MTPEEIAHGFRDLGLVSDDARHSLQGLAGLAPTPATTSYETTTASHTAVASRGESDAQQGKPSSLGPIDPHFGGIPAHGVLEEFNRAIAETKADPGKIPIWQAIVAKYSPSLLGECQKAITWSNQMTDEWLQSGMFFGEPDAKDKSAAVVKELADHAVTLSHARHLHRALPRDRSQDHIL